MKLTDEVARAISKVMLGPTEQERDWEAFKPDAQAAIAVFARWLMEPFDNWPEERKDYLTLAVNQAMKHETDLCSEAVCRALAAHIEDGK